MSKPSWVLYADRCGWIAAAGSEAFRDLVARGRLDQADLKTSTRQLSLGLDSPSDKSRLRDLTCA